MFNIFTSLVEIGSLYPQTHDDGMRTQDVSRSPTLTLYVPSCLEFVRRTSLPASGPYRKVDVALAPPHLLHTFLHL